MWMFTTDGFFSTVQDDYCGQDEVMVRARCRQDLEALRSRMGWAAEVLTTPQADYRWRMKVSRSQWAAYAAQAAGGIDYPNFKAQALDAAGRHRSRAYHACWAALHGWQDTEDEGC